MTNRRLPFSQLALRLAAILCLTVLPSYPDTSARARAAALPDGLNEARIARICSEVEAIRDLSFKRPVNTAVQSPEAFKAFVEREILRQYGEDGMDAYMRALVKLGVLESPLDLKEMFLDLMEDQAAAHYDPETETYFILATNAPPPLFDLISSHELCHALQDQHFDLQAFVQEDVAAIRDNADSAAARQALVEGEATLVMTTWTIMRQMGIEKPESARPIASSAVALQGAMSTDDILRLARFTADDPAASAMGLAMGELENCPRFVIEQLLFAYLQGAVMVDFIRSRGGWEAVNQLYTNPPQSTEQILHPEKLLGERDEPIDVRLPRLTETLPAGWRLLEQNVLGELGIRVLLQTWLGSEAEQLSTARNAAAGWGGDRYYYFVCDSGNNDLLVWKTIWDSWEDATGFVVAYRAALAARFPQSIETARSTKPDSRVQQTWEVEPGRYLKLFRQDRIVGVVDTTDPGLPGSLWTQGVGEP